MKGDCIPMKLRRFLSCMMALLLVCSLPLSAFAAEYDLAQGSVTVNASESGQTVTHGTNDPVSDDAPVIIQSNNETPTSNTITITATENATANVTIQDVNIVVSDDALTDHGDEAAVTIDVADGAKANVTLDGVNIDVSGTGGDIISDQYTGEAAVKITGNGDVTLELDGESTVQSGYYRAGVEKNTTDDGSNGKGNLTITDETGFSGSLKATGGYEGAGIGGGYEGIGSNITITGSAEVTAQGGENSAGIGGGCWCGGSDITIKGSAKVTAQGGEGSAGIGGGYDGSGSNINISGSAEVIATGGKYGAGIGGGLDGSGSNINISGSAEVIAAGGISGAGIGGGYNLAENGTGSNITVSEDAQVKAQGGKSDQAYNVYYGAGAAIGNGGKWSENSSASITGREITPYTQYLGKGWIATYAPCTEDMNTANPKRLTYRVLNTVATSDSAQAIPKKEPTCTEGGYRAGFMIGNTIKVGGEQLPATGHSMGKFYTVTQATCKAEGLERADCKNCDHYVTSSLDKVDHSYGEYTSDNNATCTSDGTKTRKCIWCNLPDTVPDTGSKLKHELEFHTVTAATCQQEGLERADCKNCNYYETNILKKVDHSYGEYTSNNNATCTSDGTKTRKCIWCDLPDTVPDTGSMLKHSFTNYISNNDATYDHDGTKTAKCDHCDATHTIPDPGSKLVREEAAQTAPLYRVIDQDGKALACKTVRKDGVLNITVDADYAALTGKLGGIQTLKAQGVDTIVFVTNNATSTFALSDLLSQGSTGDSYTLVHDGSTVTFTLGAGKTDVSDILAKP